MNPLNPRQAILQVADTGPLESLVVMLRSVGFDCYLPNERLRQELRRIGCDTVVEINSLVRRWGYDAPGKEFELPYAELEHMNRTDILYIDVKGHRNGSKVIKKWPNLQEKVLWYRINGSKPEHVINERGDHGDEMNPPCPVLTPNQWYHDKQFPIVEQGKAYACWPPFYRFDDYKNIRYDGLGYSGHYTEPICLVHNLGGWGYSPLAESFMNLGVKLYGVASPNGLLPHRQVKNHLSSSLAYVHLKSNDAPGYSLYEALASACPVICTRRLIWRCRMQDLFIPNETCLVFDRETHEGLTNQDIIDCTQEVNNHLERLKDPVENRRIGEAGRERLRFIMWSEKNPEDVRTLHNFFVRNFCV